MKSILKYTLLLLGSAALLLSGCKLEQAPEWDEPAALYARIEGASSGSGTKTAYDSDGPVGEFQWSEGDQIAVHFSNGSYVTGTVAASTGEVSVQLPSGATRDYYAVYPATAAVADNYGNPTLQITYPASYDISDIVSGSSTTRTADFSPCPMVAVNDVDSDVLCFYHVGGLLRITIAATAVPAATQQVRLTFDKDVTGTYAVTNPGSTAPTITTAGTAANNVVSFTLTDSDGSVGSLSENLVLNVPVPCGTYEGFTVECVDLSGAVIASEVCTRSLTLARHHGKKLILQPGAQHFLLEGDIPANLQTSHFGGTVILAADFLSCLVNNGNLTPEAFVFQHSASGDEGSWTDGLPDWLSSPATNMSGATSATSVVLTLSPLATTASERSAYVRILQPASGQSTAACRITQGFLLFSMGANKQVLFAHGNLVVENIYNGSANNRVWKFEDNQYDYNYGTEGDGSYSVNGKTKRISHFGWATAAVKNPDGGFAYDANHTRFYPHQTQTASQASSDANLANEFRYGPSIAASSSEYWAVSGSVNLPFGINNVNNTWNRDGLDADVNKVRKYCDWGIHFNDAGAGSNNTDGVWYTPSVSEWNHLIDVRSQHANLFGEGRIYIEGENRYVNGLFILPDDWVLPSGCQFGPGGDYTTNTYTTGNTATGYDGTWSAMEAAGVVFLPAAGSRSSWTFSHENNAGYYWSSSASNNNSDSQFAHSLRFTSGDVSPQNYLYRYYGCCVRLVRDLTSGPVAQYVLQGTVPATLSVVTAGATVNLATNFLSYVNNGSTNTKEPFVLQYSATGADGSWSNGLPDWLSSPGTDLSGATTATTISLTASAQSGQSDVRSVHVRVLQTSSGKTTSACQITQAAYVLGNIPAALTVSHFGGTIPLSTDFRSCLDNGSSASKEPFKFQYSSNGTSGWSDGLPSWLSSSGIDLSGAAGATTPRLVLSPLATDATSERSTYIRIVQTNSGKETSACKITQGFLTFSVSDTKKVIFAHGNLVVTYQSNGNHLWEFESNQWDYSYGTDAGQSYAGKSNYQTNGTRISHFGWATAGVKNPASPANAPYGYDVNHKRFYPYNIEMSQITSSDANLGNSAGYGPSVSVSSPYVWANSGGVNLPHGIVEGNSWNAGSRSDPTSAWNTVRPYCDWGVHFNIAGEGDNNRTDGTWYTLSAYEWKWLIERRGSYTQGGCRIFIESENRYVYGAFILPDVWSLPAGNVISGYSLKYTTGDNTDGFNGKWSDMEAAGAVFFPYSYSRWEFSFDNEHHYWTSSANNYQSTLFEAMFIRSTSVGPSLGTADGRMRFIGKCVRLVHDK